MVNIKEYLQNNYPCFTYGNLLESFVRFMVDNKWFGTKPTPTTINGERTLLFGESEFHLFESELRFFMDHKDLSDDKKAELLLEKLSQGFKHTAKTIGDFMCGTTNAAKISLYGFLNKFLQKEVCDYTNKEMAELVDFMCHEISLKAGRLFTDYLFTLRQNCATAFDNDYVLNSRNSEPRTKSAYSSDMYLRLAYYLFCGDYIEKEGLIERACENYLTANTWLYLAIHMICSLRDTDVVMLPRPIITKDPLKVIEEIKNGTLTETEAKKYALSVTRQIDIFRKKPEKTKDKSMVPSIKLIIPDSALSMFGRLFALVDAHLKLLDNDDSNFIRPVRDYERICRYLGDDIGYLFLEDDFSVRSSNKAYMQLVELFADNVLETQGYLTHVKGYMLAALARSHKGSFGEFAESTEIYLKDAKMSGYSPEFILKELFERGVCSFIPAILLKMVTDGEYDKLPIKSQTEMIKELAISPYDVDILVAATENAIDAAENTVKEMVQMFNEPEEIQRDYIRMVLQNIAAGGASSKTDNCMCLMTAMGKGCKSPDAGQCIGCRYEISTKSTVFHLMSEYNRLQRLKQKAQTPQISEKYASILRNVIVPKIAEILYCMGELYGSESAIELEELIKEWKA